MDNYLKIEMREKEKKKKFHFENRKMKRMLKRDQTKALLKQMKLSKTSMPHVF